MIKEAGLFIISAGALVYFISTKEEEPKPKPVVVEAVKTVNASANQEPEYWGDDEDDEQDGFVFGEPVKYDEDNEQLVVEPSGSGQSVQSAIGNVYQERQVLENSPAPGEPGSRENPVVMPATDSGF